MRWEHWICPFAFSLVSCAAPDEPERACPEDRLAIAIQDETGALPSAFQITLDVDGAEVVAANCEQGACDNERVLPTATGVEVHGRPAAIGLVVKAKGSRTYAQRPALDFAHESGPAGACGGYSLVAHLAAPLVPLPAAVANADYRTGFSVENGLAELTELAVQMRGEMGEAFVVKFFAEGIRSAEPQVYFQNTAEHPLHYQFVRSVLGRAVSLSDYEAMTYHGEDRQQMAGSIIYYPQRAPVSSLTGTSFSAPITVEFFPSDNLSPELALIAYRLIEERLQFVPLKGSEHRLFYVPATASHDAAAAGADYSFRAASALWLRPEDLYAGISVQYLNPGTACGTLRLMTAEELEVTPVSYKDILVLTRLPNYLPIVGGTITEELQTPLAHVNVAARNRGTPNMALVGAAQDERITPLLGKLVRFEVSEGSFTLAEITIEEAQQFWDDLIPESPTVPTSDLEATGLLPFAELGFDDAIRVGVKAANLAELRRLIGDNTPDGFAVPFRYYHEHMTDAILTSAMCLAAEGDCVDEGREASLCGDVRELCLAASGDAPPLQEYAGALIADYTFTADTVFREAALNGLRYIVRNAPVAAALGSELDAAVAALVGGGQVRLRSSTNSEDLPNFSGAGLYTSVSASASGAEAASQRIQKVWASVWSFAAFEERAFWNIDHLATKMGVAVHVAFPDEAVNGVLITQNIANPAVSGIYVNVQLGEESVTNPVGGALPEVFSIIWGAGGLEAQRQRYSSLSPSAPLMSEEEVRLLYQRAMQVQAHFAPLYGEDASTFALDMEFKLLKPDRHLIIKQVRPYAER